MNKRIAKKWNRSLAERISFLYLVGKVSNTKKLNAYETLHKAFESHFTFANDPVIMISHDSHKMLESRITNQSEFTDMLSDMKKHFYHCYKVHNFSYFRKLLHRTPFLMLWTLAHTQFILQGSEVVKNHQLRFVKHTKPTKKSK